jgi:hypothetical protein
LKNKRLTYLLFPLVALIWGYAIYKYLFADYEGQSTAPLVGIAPVSTADASPIARDTFSLLLTYRDPFLGTVAAEPFRPTVSNTNEPRPEVAAANTSSRPATVDDPPIDWGRYQYNGLIQHSGTADLVGILRMGGKAHYVNVGSTVQGTTVLTLSPDSIGLRVADLSKTIGRH